MAGKCFVIRKLKSREKRRDNLKTDGISRSELGDGYLGAPDNVQLLVQNYLPETVRKCRFGNFFHDLRLADVADERSIRSVTLAKTGYFHSGVYLF